MASEVQVQCIQLHASIGSTFLHAGLFFVNIEQAHEFIASITYIKLRQLLDIQIKYSDLLRVADKYTTIH